MKLRNKKTGEIQDFNVIIHELNMFNSLAELDEEWEDYDDTKDGWCISYIGSVKQYREYVTGTDVELCKQIGNYFETKEEAEKAVERLRAWKRLKDKGFRFKGWNTAFCEIDFDVPDSFYPIDGNMITNETEKDLDLLFSQEDD